MPVDDFGGEKSSLVLKNRRRKLKIARRKIASIIIGWKVLCSIMRRLIFYLKAMPVVGCFGPTHVTSDLPFGKEKSFSSPTSTLDCFNLRMSKTSSPSRKTDNLSFHLVNDLKRPFLKVISVEQGFVVQTPINQQQIQFETFSQGVKKQLIQLIRPSLFKSQPMNPSMSLPFLAKVFLSLIAQLSIFNQPTLWFRMLTKCKLIISWLMAWLRFNFTCRSVSAVCSFAQHASALPRAY